MPAPPAQSSLRVDVVFSDPVYFAGEDLVCRITFRNLAPGPQLHHSSASDLQRTTSASRLRKSSRASSVSDADRPPTSPASTPPPPQPSLSAAPSTPRTPSSSSFGPPLAPSSPSSSFSSSTTTSPLVVQTASQNGSFPSPSPVHASPHGMLHSRRSSMRVPKTRGGETLMMGYAQLSGQFTIDESLVETSVFNEAKKLGIVGGKMGGGVVGLGAEKSDSGIWGQLGFGITNGLSSLLNGNEVSSIAEMKSIASSNVISIISTPQSLLFVDLRLSPGESKSYSYRFTLPKTLPPSYRGKALKISYNLTIGTQRVGKGFQAPKTTKFPFRVFQNIDAGGHQPVHSLTSPIVILRDEAKTEVIDDGPELNRASSVSSLSGLTSNSESKRLARDNPQSENKETLEDFMAYVDGLLSYKSSIAVAIHHIRPPSPSSPPEFPLSSSVTSARSSCRESVDLAIQRNSISADGIVLNNMYEIARNKQKIASLVLSKPVYKLGETVVMILDFAGAVLPCYHVIASLETTEIIDNSIAQRSSQFNERATRKVYVQSSFSTISSQRASFSFCIPTTATPQFDTSYISSRWSIRIEFVTSPIEMPANLLPAIDLDEETDRSSAPQSRSGSQGTIDIPEPAQTPPSAQTFRNGQPHTPSTPIHERTSSLNATASPAPGNGTRARADSQQLQAVLQVSRTLAKTTLSDDDLSVTDDEDVEDDDEHDDEKADVFHGLSVARAQRRPSATNTPPSYAATKSHRPEILRVTHKDERGVMYSLVDDLLSETFECRIPIKVFPTNQDIAAMSFHIQPSGGYAV